MQTEAAITVWAVEARYPGDWPGATPDDAQRAAARARAVCPSVITDMIQRGAKLKEG